MISLCMDSAYKALVLGLYKDGTLIDGVSIEAFKKQSETIFVELNQLFEKTGLDYKDVDEVIITDGPGSYTGIRIAMTIAKVFCTQMHKTLKCISTMQLFAGMDESANVIMENCIRCHTQLNTELVKTGRMNYEMAKAGEGKACWDCHRDIPHGGTNSLSSTPNALVPYPKSDTPDWLKKILNDKK